MTITLARKIGLALAALALVGPAGCTFTTVEAPAPGTVVATPAPTVVATPAPATVVAAPAPGTVVTAQDGRWQLYGDGRATPYYWVWIPAGVTPPPPPAYPAVSGAGVVVAPPSDRIVYTEGRWQLFGDGRTTAYYWMWVPAGTIVAYRTPPPLPQGR